MRIKTFLEKYAEKNTNREGNIIYKLNIFDIIGRNVEFDFITFNVIIKRGTRHTQQLTIKFIDDRSFPIFSYKSDFTEAERRIYEHWQPYDELSYLIFGENYINLIDISDEKEVILFSVINLEYISEIEINIDSIYESNREEIKLDNHILAHQKSYNII